MLKLMGSSRDSEAVPETRGAQLIANVRFRYGTTSGQDRVTNAMLQTLIQSVTTHRQSATAAGSAVFIRSKAKSEAQFWLDSKL